MSKELTERILQQYGLTPRQIHTVQKGYRNESYAAELADGRTVNLIIYKREGGIVDRIRAANQVSNYAAAHGLPVRKTIDPRIVRLGKGDFVKYAALYNYLPGHTIPWEAYTMDHIKQVGAGLNNLHTTLQPMPHTDIPYVVDECRAMVGRMERYFADDGVHDAMAGKLCLAILDTTRLRPALTKGLDLPGQQALHMDFVRGNILFEGNDEPQISGILDFEKTAWGAPIFDIARTLAFLIVDCKYKEEAKVRKYFLYSGYNKRGNASFEPTPLLEDLINFFLLHDFYKFLRHNPYESLKHNEHFVRTRDFLLKRNILAQTEMLH
jgi:Ser/Thr protein kinase RdoA (MazF antagonist)